MLKEAKATEEFDIVAEAAPEEGDFEALASDPSVYEIGYHLLPTLAEDETAAAITDMRALIEGKGGVILAEDPMRRLPLAYPMMKKVAGKNEYFSQAAFVWLKCELPASAAPEMKKALEENSRVLRSLFASTVREDTLLAGRQFLRSEQKEKDKREGRTVPEAEKAPLSEEDLNRSLEKMIAE